MSSDLFYSIYVRGGYMMMRTRTIGWSLYVFFWKYSQRYTRKLLCATLVSDVLTLPRVFAAFFHRPGREGGPLGFLSQIESVGDIETVVLHRRLVAYYRILQANRAFPRTSSWPLAPLSKLISAPLLDNGVRLLAIRCYALQAGIMEGERVKMENNAIGDVESIDCPITYSTRMDGTRIQVDGWILPAVEAKRVVDYRNALLQTQDHYSFDGDDSQEPIHPAELR